MRRNTGSDRRSKRIEEETNRLLRSLWQFTVTAIVVAIIVWIPLKVWAEAEITWTDFSPKPIGEADATTEVVVDTLIPIAQVVHGVEPEELKTASSDLDKEKYRVYFEDKGLVLMVLGGLEYWKLNCGTLSSTGDYFMKLAVKKHSIDIDEMNMDASFQAGLFAATLYNDCDIFLEQTKSIGLGMMFKKTPQEIILDTVPETNI